MAAIIGKISNANIYINGVNMLGQTEELEPPNIKHSTTEFKGLGLIGTPKFFAGIESMEQRIKWSSFYADAMVVAANPTKAAQLQIRFNVERYTSQGLGTEEAGVLFLSGTFNNIPTGSFKQKENAEFESMMDINYVKMEIGGRSIYEIDILANIYKVDGVDILKNYNQNLGI